MQTEVLAKKTTRYLHGDALPAETRQIQTWLSCTNNAKDMAPEERAKIEDEILKEIQVYTAYLLFHPKPEPWWKKITAFF